MCSQVSPIPQLWPASSWGPWAGRKGNVSSPLTLSTGVAGRSSLARYHGSSLDSDVEPTSRSWERSPHCQAPPPTASYGTPSISLTPAWKPSSAGWVALTTAARRAPWDTAHCPITVQQCSCVSAFCHGAGALATAFSSDSCSIRGYAQLSGWAS